MEETLMTNQLLPCPFCGKTDTLGAAHTSVAWWIECECGAELCSMDSSTESLAVAAWNRRADEPTAACDHEFVNVDAMNTPASEHWYRCEKCGAPKVEQR